MNATEQREEKGGQITAGMPRCPYCGTQPARVQSRPFLLNPTVEALTIFCAEPACSKILAIQILGIRPPAEPLIIPANGHQH